MPGETYYTLKEKATTQAKKAGMPQDRAENYGRTMANISVTEGQTFYRDPSHDFFGAGDTTKPVGEYQATAGIEDKANLEKLAAERKSAQKFKEKEGGVYDPKQGKVVYPEKKTGIFDAGLDTIQNLWLKSSPTIQAALGLGKGFKTLFGGVAPTIEQLQDPNFLAIMKEVLKGDRKDQFVEDYKDLIAEAGYTDSEDFETALDEAEIPQGSEAQRRLEPWNYYDQDLYETSGEQAKALEGYPEFLTSMGLEPTSSRFAATSGNLEKIAKIPLDSIPYDEQGRKFRRQVLAAREQVGRDRDRRERQSGGGGGGIFPPDPIDPIDPIDPDPTLPDPPPGTTPILPPGTTLTPGPFDYLQWPQFTSAYPGHYANQGIPGQAWPQYDYWNQIAKTFPGMR